MVNDFLLSFQIRNTYLANSIIYLLKKLPFLGKLIPSTLYSNSGLKTFAQFIGFLFEMFSFFIGKFLYLSIMIVSVSALYKGSDGAFFLHAFLFLTIAGGFLNSNILNPSKDKYYAICLMKYDAKRYALSNYIYFLIKMLLGFLPFTILFGLTSNLPLFICFLLPIFVVFVKLMIGALGLYDSTKKKKVKNENLPNIITIFIIGVLLGVTYIPPFFGLFLSETHFLIVFAFSFFLSVPALFYIVHSTAYTRLYKELLTPNTVLINREVRATEINKKSSLNQINADVVSDSGKTGYSFFHDIFVKRHKKMLFRATIRISFALILLILGVLMAVIFSNEFAASVSRAMSKKLPYFLFVMYVINRGDAITKMMFINCDRSMLTYRFYRQPTSILWLFKERLKTLIKLNLIPGTIIAFGCSLILLVAGETSILNYSLIILSILSMSIFFSVHYLVIYYLMQPYTLDIEMKDPRFGIINGITYFVCYFAIQVNIPTLVFGIGMISFTILYSTLSLAFAYRYAPKTFKLRN